MSVRLGLGLLAVLAIAGCENDGDQATPVESTRSVAAADALVMATKGERLRYSGPTRSARAAPEFIGEDYSDVWDNAVDVLTKVGFEFSQLDEREGVITARYSGDPGDYVDCGRITTEAIDRSSQRQLEASAASLQIGRDRLGTVRTVSRELQLDARLALQFTPEGDDRTGLQSSSTYVLTKTSTVYARAEQVEDSGSEIIFFDTFGSASFAKGTTCQATGILENLIFVGLADS